MKKLSNINALVISDLHIFTLQDIAMVEKMMEKLKQRKYDAIYLVGDIIDATNILYHDKITGRLLELMAFLGHIAPTYIVYGSHDLAFRTDSKKEPWAADEATFKNKFLDQIAGYKNINILENEAKELVPGYTISGINPSLAYAMKSPDGDNEQLLKELDQFSFLRNLDSTNVNVLLCHYPNAIMTLKQKTDLLDKVYLSIAGHNHNGCTQFRFLPVEKVLDFFRQNNRGLITPGKSLKPSDTALLRGKVTFDDQSILIMNPAVKTFAACTGPLEKLDSLFYKGCTEINYQFECRKLHK